MDLYAIFSCLVCFGLIRGNPLGGSKIEPQFRGTDYQTECCLCNDFDDDTSNDCSEQRCLKDLNAPQHYFTSLCEYCQYTKQYTGSIWKSKVQCSIKPLCEHDHSRTIATPGCFGGNSPANGTTCYYCCRPGSRFDPVEYCIKDTFSGYTKFDRFSHITDVAPPLTPSTPSSTVTTTTATTTKATTTSSTTSTTPTTTPSTTTTTTTPTSITTTTTTPSTTTTSSPPPTTTSTSTSTTTTPATTTATSTIAQSTSLSTTVPTTSSTVSLSNKPTQHLAECSVCESFDGTNCNGATAACDGQCRNRLIYSEAGTLIRVIKSCVLNIECTESLGENDAALCSPDLVNRTSSTQFICSYCCDPKSSTSPCNVDMYSRQTTPVPVSSSSSSIGQTTTTPNISSPSTVIPLSPNTLNVTSDVSRSSTLSAGSSNSISTVHPPTTTFGGSNSTYDIHTFNNQTVIPTITPAELSSNSLTTKDLSNSSVARTTVSSSVNTSKPSVSSATNTSSGTASGAYSTATSGSSSGRTATAIGSSFTRSPSTNTNGKFNSSSTTVSSVNTTGPSVSSATHNTSGNSSAVFGSSTPNFPFRNSTFPTTRTTSSGKIYSPLTQTLSSGKTTRMSSNSNTSVPSMSTVSTSTSSNVKPELTPSPSWHKKLGSTQCMTCIGSMEDCDILYGETTCTEPDNYCINFMKNSERGEVTVNRTCGNLNRCYREWFQGSSDNDKCQNFRDGQVITVGFECTYCCIEDLCNEQISPKQSTLYEDK